MADEQKTTLQVKDQRLRDSTWQLKAERLQQENDTMLTILAHADLPCLYCGLSLADMGKCRDGFPGCGRADDMMVGVLPEKYKFLEVPMPEQAVGTGGVLSAPNTVCPRCGAVGKVEMRNYEMMWHEGDIHCAECGTFIRKFDAG